MRKNLKDLLANHNLNYTNEFNRINKLFHQKYLVQKEYIRKETITAQTICNDYFLSIPPYIRSTTTSLNDFLEEFEIITPDDTFNYTLDDYLPYLEFLTNISVYILDNENPFDYERSILNTVLKQIKISVAALHMQFIQDDNIWIIVPNDPAALSAAEVVSDINISLCLLKYNHYLLKGDIAQKEKILIDMASYLEGNKETFNQNNGTLFSLVRRYFNNFNLRHNNLTGPNKRDYLDTMTDSQREDTLDDLYQLCLLLILENDNISRKKEMNELINKINGIDKN